MAVESMPPDRNAPTVTSARMCFATESRSTAAIRRGASAPPPRVQHRREVALGFGFAARGHGDVGARLDPTDRPVQRGGLGHVLEQQVVLQCGGVEIAVDAAQAQRGREFEEALLLAGERDARRALRHEQRLDPERVARDEQHPVPGVPDREGEHAAQPGHGGRAPVVVGGHDRLGVALGGERRPQVRELGPQLQVVVDLAVEDDRVTIVGVAQRLVRVLDVDDRQPVEPEDDVRIVPRAAFVRSAVPCAAHGLPDGRRRGWARWRRR